MIKVKKELTINGTAVALSHQAFGLKFYERVTTRGDDCGQDFFVVRGEDVLGEINITADCGQNMGFVDEVNFKEYSK